MLEEAGGVAKYEDKSPAMSALKTEAKTSWKHSIMRSPWSAALRLRSPPGFEELPARRYEYCDGPTLMNWVREGEIRGLEGRERVTFDLLRLTWSKQLMLQRHQ